MKLKMYETTTERRLKDEFVVLEKTSSRYTSKETNPLRSIVVSNKCALVPVLCREGLCFVDCGKGESEQRSACYNISHCSESGLLNDQIETLNGLLYI